MQNNKQNIGKEQETDIERTIRYVLTKINYQREKDDNKLENRSEIYDRKSNNKYNRR